MVSKAVNSSLKCRSAATFIIKNSGAATCSNLGVCMSASDENENNEKTVLHIVLSAELLFSKVGRGAGCVSKDRS